MLTVEEVERRSHRRSRDGWVRLAVVAVLMVFVFLVLAAGLQAQASLLAKEQAKLEAALRDQCDQRKANVMLANKRWEDLIAVEERNPVGDPTVIAERVRIYRASMLTMPTC